MFKWHFRVTAVKISLFVQHCRSFSSSTEYFVCDHVYMFLCWIYKCEHIFTLMSINLWIVCLCQLNELKLWVPRFSSCVQKDAAGFLLRRSRIQFNPLIQSVVLKSSSKESGSPATGSLTEGVFSFNTHSIKTQTYCQFMADVIKLKTDWEHQR